MLKHHLNGGVRKGALTQEIADKKFADWLKEKEAKIQTKKDNLLKVSEEDKIKRLAAEKQASEKRLEDAAAKEAAAAQDVSSSDETPAVEETPTTDEAPAAEEVSDKDNETAKGENNSKNTDQTKILFR